VAPQLVPEVINGSFPPSRGDHSLTERAHPKAAWLSNFPTEVGADHRLDGFVWSNLDKRREGEPDWRLQSDAESLDVFNHKANSQDAQRDQEASVLVPE
jgi:hypothetical protein